MAKTIYRREELEQQLAESRREFRAADATIHNLELKLADMAVQLANAESKCAALAAELEAAEKRIAELTEALKQSTEGYKSCLRMGYDRIVDLGGDCDEPKVMINNNPDIQQSEKLLSAGIITKVGE